MRIFIQDSEKETEEKKEHSATRVCRQYVGNDVGEMSATESGEQKHERVRKEIEKRKEVGDVGKDCDIACKCRRRRSSGSTAGRNHGPAGVAQELSGKKEDEKNITRCTRPSFKSIVLNASTHNPGSGRR